MKKFQIITTFFMTDEQTQAEDFKKFKNEVDDGTQLKEMYDDRIKDDVARFVAATITCEITNVE